MNHIKKIGLFVTILLIESVGHARDFHSQSRSLYSHDQSTDDTFEDSNTDKKTYSHQNEMSDDALRDQINDFIARSYISPRLQNTIFQIYDKPFTLDKTTGRPVLLNENNQPMNWPTIDEILSKQINSQDLQSLQEVIGIAINFAVQHFAFHATHKALVVKHTTAEETAVMTKLREYKTHIENLMTQPNFSNKKSTIFTQKQIDDINKKLQEQNIVSYSTDHVKRNFLGDAHDFKRVHDASTAAQLLFKQCYTAQNDLSLEKKQHDIVRHLIDQAIKKHKNSQTEIHVALVQIAIAVQTALSIAENEYGQSWYNPARYNPFGSKHSLISCLEKMYQEVEKELIKKEHGASEADLNRKYYIDLARNVATGILVTAAVIGTVATAKYTYDNADVLKLRAENAYKSTKDTVVNAPSNVYQATSKIAQLGYDATLGKLVGTLPTTAASALLEQNVKEEEATLAQLKKEASIAQATNDPKLNVLQQKIKNQEIVVAQQAERLSNQILKEQQAAQKVEAQKAAQSGKSALDILKEKEERAAQELQQAQHKFAKAKLYPDKAAQQNAEKVLNEKRQAHAIAINKLGEQQKAEAQIAHASLLKNLPAGTPLSQALKEQVDTLKEQSKQLEREFKVARDLKYHTWPAKQAHLNALNKQLETAEKQYGVAQAQEELQKKEAEFNAFTNKYNSNNPIHIGLLKKEQWELEKAQNALQKAESELYPIAQTESQSDVSSQPQAAAPIAAVVTEKKPWFPWSSNTPAAQAPVETATPLVQAESKSDVSSQPQAVAPIQAAATEKKSWFPWSSNTPAAQAPEKAVTSDQSVTQAPAARATTSKIKEAESNILLPQKSNSMPTFATSEKDIKKPQTKAQAPVQEKDKLIAQPAAAQPAQTIAPQQSSVLSRSDLLNESIKLEELIKQKESGRYTQTTLNEISKLKDQREQINKAIPNAPHEKWVIESQLEHGKLYGFTPGEQAMLENELAIYNR